MTLDPALVDTLNLVLRWAHVIAAIAWIGSSFFFVWLDDSLEPAPDKGPHVQGRLWMTHSGGFYDVVKFKVTMPVLPDHLHWFRWEAAWTGITGIFLLVVVFYLGADGLLVPADSALSRPEAAAVGLGGLALSWLIYDFIWRRKIVERHGLAFSWLSLAALSVPAWAFMQVFTARAAFLHTGAMMGLIMVLNVWVIIIPGQRRMIEALKKGEAPDAAFGKRAKIRSMHNSYVTLGVVAIMLSGHSPLVTGHRQAWAVLIVLLTLGAAIRHVFIVRHTRKPSRALVSAIAITSVALFFWLRPPAMDAGSEPVSFGEVRGIIITHCVGCHATHPTFVGLSAPPKNVVLETPTQVRQNAAKIMAQVVHTRMMPLGNMTKMTEEERQRIGRWIAQGANIP